MVAQSGQLAQRAHPPRRRPRLALPLDREPLLYGILGFVVVLVAWEAVVDAGLIKSSLMSSPTRIVAAAIQDFGTGAIMPDIGTSALEWAVGFFVALGVSVPLGLVLGSFRKLEYLVDPWLSGLYATPTIALAPLLILIFGVELNSKFAIVFLEAWVTITVSTIVGVHAADKRHLETAQSFGASKWLIFRSVTLPSSVPFIITGVRVGAGRALVGVIVGEFIVANVGLGYYISLYGTLLNSSRVMLGVFLLGVFGITLGQIIRRIEMRFERWRPAIN